MNSLNRSVRSGENTAESIKMKRYCPVCQKMVTVKKVGHRYYKCQECGHNIRMKRREKEDVTLGTFGYQR